VSLSNGTIRVFGSMHAEAISILSRQEEERERRETLENDRLVREQQRGSTFHQHAVSQAADLAGGRFGSLGAPHVVGSQPTPRYPAAAAHQADPVGPEPPTGYDVNAMPGFESSTDLSAVESSAAPPAEATGGAAAAPPASCSLSSDVERAAPPPFSVNDEDR